MLFLTVQQSNSPTVQQSNSPTVQQSFFSFRAMHITILHIDMKKQAKEAVLNYYNG